MRTVFQILVAFYFFPLDKGFLVYKTIQKCVLHNTRHVPLVDEDGLQNEMCNDLLSLTLKFGLALCMFYSIKRSISQ